jgi:DNA-binding NtrC family response regulator
VSEVTTMRNAGKARVYGKLEVLRQPPRPGPRTLHELLALHERLIIIQALQRHAFSRTQTAESLGVSRNYLWRRMRLLHIDFAALPRTTPGRPRKRSA